jgi:hypothetical protein
MSVNIYFLKEQLKAEVANHLLSFERKVRLADMTCPLTGATAALLCRSYHALHIFAKSCLTALKLVPVGAM